MRAALPPGFAKPGFDREDFRATFAALAGRVAREVDPDALLDRFADRFIDARRPFLRGHMQALEGARDLTPDSIVGCRAFLACRIVEEEKSVTARFHGNEITLPVFAAPALRYALETPRFRIADLPGDLDDQGKVVLARRLIREGLLRPVGKD